MNFKYLYFSLLVVAIFFTSCSTVKIEKPNELYTNQKVEVKPSVISFNIQSRVADIQEEINKQFQGLVYEDNNLSNDNVMVKAWKQGEFKVDMNNNVLSYRIPLKLWVKAGFEISKFGLTVSDYRELNGAIALKFKTAVTINPDWSITTKTEAEGYEWLNAPAVKIAGMDMSVKFIADILMQGSVKSIGPKVDKSLKEYLDFKPYAQKAWAIMDEPFNLNEQYNVWLQVCPQSLMTSQLNGNKGVIGLNTAVTASIEMSMGNKPETRQSRNLPSLQLGKAISPEASINAFINVSFDEINKQAATFLVGKTFEQGKRKVKVERVNIYGSNGKLVAETQLSGSLKGTLYFTGVPSYNPSDSTVVINEFDYDISTKNFLVKSASWLYQDGFRKLIAQNLKWSIKNDMKEINHLLNSTLSSYTIQEGVLLKGTVNKLLPGSIVINPSGITTEITANGRLGLTITPKFN